LKVVRLTNMKDRARRTTPEEFGRLMQEAKSGSDKALGELCTATYAMVYRFIYTKVNHEQDAEDLASEVCVRVIGRLAGVSGSFVGWVLQISSNMVVDYYRRRDVRNRYQDEVRADDMAEAELPAERSVMYSEIRQLFQYLTDEQQQVVTLKFMEGYTTDEIAGALDKPPGAIRALQFRALSSLRQMIDGKAR